MRSFLRSLGRRLFGHNPATVAVVGSKAVKVPSLGERIARKLAPAVRPSSPVSLYNGAARSDAAVFNPKNPHRPRNARRRRTERRKRARLHKAGR